MSEDQRDSRDDTPNDTANHTANDTDVPDWWQSLLDRDEEIIPLQPAGMASPPTPQPPTPRPKAPPKSGILVIDKPAGLTSHDVVQRVRRAADERRVGHAGTLDPAATGVLVVCIGSATRVVEAVQSGDKTYEATVRFGLETASHDLEGDVTAEADASGLSGEAVEVALAAFRGNIEQVPPMVSALKHGGRRLYELAREGVSVEREPRPARVDRLELVDWSPPDARLILVVSKGFYVRALARDLGRAVGPGATLAALRRTRVGHFRLDEAVTVDEMESAFAEDWWTRILHPLDAALIDRSALVVDQETETAIRHGQQVEGPAPNATTTDEVRVYNRDGLFVGLVRWDPVTDRWQPDKVFPKA